MKLLTEALSLGEVTALRDVVSWLYTAFDNTRFAIAGEATEYLYHTYREWDGFRLDAVAGLLNLDPLLAPPLALATSIMPNLVYRPRFSFFRRSGRAESTVQWHCDAEGVGTARFPVGCVNVWLPLDSVGGGERPSLELIDSSDAAMRDAPILADGERYREDDWVATLPGAHVVPQLDPGDVLLFDHWTLHRTELLADPLSRLSCELRFAA